MLKQWQWDAMFIAFMLGVLALVAITDDWKVPDNSIYISNDEECEK